MTWTKIDDGFWHHPKTLAAGPLAAHLFLAILGYCNRYLTDGSVPAGALQSLVAWGGAASNEDLAERLVEVGLLIRKGDRLVVHDYTEYQPSRREVLARRRAISESRSAAGKAGARKRWQGKATDSKRMANAWQENRNPSESLSINDGKADGKPMAAVRKLDSKRDSKPMAPITEISGIVKQERWQSGWQTDSPDPVLREDVYIDRTSKDLSGSARESGRTDERRAPTELPVPCPGTLQLTEDQLQALQLGIGIPPGAAHAITGMLVSRWVGGERRMPLSGWRKYLAAAVSKDWSDGDKRRAALSVVKSAERSSNDGSEARARAARREEACRAKLQREADEMLAAEGIVVPDDEQGRAKLVSQLVSELATKLGGAL